MIFFINFIKFMTFIQNNTCQSVLLLLKYLKIATASIIYLGKRFELAFIFHKS